MELADAGEDCPRGQGLWEREGGTLLGLGFVGGSHQAWDSLPITSALGHPGDSHPNLHPETPSVAAPEAVWREGPDAAPPVSGWVIGVASFLDFAPPGGLLLPLSPLRL